MGKTRETRSKEFKPKVALEAFKGVHSLSERAPCRRVRPTRQGWKYDAVLTRMLAER